MTKTVLITGCSSGFGKATALIFAREGWNVVATMRDTTKAGELALHPRIFVTRLDVQDPDSIAQGVGAGIGRFGVIDVLVNNAGFGLFGVFEATPADKLREQFEVNVFGAMEVTRALLPHFRSRRAGLVVNISSGAGVFTLPLLAPYCASKFALEGFSEALSHELAPLGIAVKIVEPGGVLDTNFGARSGAEAARTPAPADYDGVAQATARLYERLSAQATSTQDDVARVIFQAATDGSDQLRYVATEDIQPLVRARRETSEAAYLQFLRARIAG